MSAPRRPPHRQACAEKSACANFQAYRKPICPLCLAHAGVILGIVGVVLGIVGMVVWVVLIASGLDLEELRRDLEESSRSSR